MWEILSIYYPLLPTVNKEWLSTERITFTLSWKLLPPWYRGMLIRENKTKIPFSLFAKVYPDSHYMYYHPFQAWSWYQVHCTKEKLHCQTTLQPAPHMLLCVPSDQKCCQSIRLVWSLCFSVPHLAKLSCSRKIVHSPDYPVFLGFCKWHQENLAFSDFAGFKGRV